MQINLADNLRAHNSHTISPNNNLKSLVSFNPKSNVLLRIHNHIDNDDDDCHDDKNTYHHYHQQQQQQQQNISEKVITIL